LADDDDVDGSESFPSKKLKYIHQQGCLFKLNSLILEKSNENNLKQSFITIFLLNRRGGTVTQTKELL
jgi:hypothetical protein